MDLSWSSDALGLVWSDSGPASEFRTMVLERSQFVGLGSGTWIASSVHMPRKPLILQSELPYHIQVTTLDGIRNKSDLASIWDVVLGGVSQCHRRYKFKSHALVLGEDRVHWIASTPLSNLGNGICFFHSHLRRRLRMAFHLKPTCRSRYKWCLIESAVHFANIYRFAYQQRVNLGPSGEDRFKWTSLDPTFPLATERCRRLSQLVPAAQEALLPWLNERPSQDFLKLTNNALKKTRFKYAASSSSRRAVSGVEYLHSRGS